MNKIKNTFRTLKYRNFRIFFGGQSISLIGTWIQIVAIGWLTYRITNSVFLLGLVGFVGSVPTFFLGPFVGVIADRFSKYRLLILTQISFLIQASVLATLVFTGSVTVWHLIILGLFGGVINAFDVPVRQSFMVEMIEKKEDLSNAIALNSIIVNSARLIGPSIAGILVAAVGEGWCFAINAMSYIAIIISLFYINVLPFAPGKENKSPLKDLKEGFNYAYGYFPIRAVLMLLALISLMGMPYQILMPVFARDVLHGGAHLMGFLMAAVGTGALAGGIYLATRKDARGLENKIAAASGVFGLGLLVFGLSENICLSMFSLLFVGFGMLLQLAGSNTMIQTLVDDDKRGRVMSFHAMAFMGTVPFGTLLGGTLSSFIGVRATVFIGGLCSILAGGLFGSKLGRIKSAVIERKGH